MPLSNVAITPGKSNDFVKFAAVLHVFGACVLFQSSVPFLMLIAMTVVLLVSMARILQNPVPVPAFVCLSHHHDHWRLLGPLGLETRFEHVCIGFDAGLFILLTLTGVTSCKKLVVFRDQLTTTQYRALNVLGAIRPKKGKMNEKY